MSAVRGPKWLVHISSGHTLSGVLGAPADVLRCCMAASEVLRDISPTRILVVDDSQVMRGCLRRLLERHPHWKVCGEACDGREAVQKAQQVGPDVIVLDFQMPEMNGLDAARSIQSQSPRVPILMVSAHMSPQLAEEARKVGIRGVCAKATYSASWKQSRPF
jgi:CheY-like chemotaxis protein